MDSHPIPQNVTSFEFHLVGDMTLKQFGYLASGLVTAYLIFVFIYSSQPLIALPLILLTSLLGVAFAFLPIQDRPLDHWVGAFFKAVFSPTKRRYLSKANVDPQNRLRVYLNSLASAPVINQVHTPVNQNIGVSAFQKLPAPTAPSDTPILQHADTPAVTPSDQQLEKTVELAKQSQFVQSQIVAAEKQIDQIKHLASAPGADQSHYQTELKGLFDELQGLIKKAQELSTQISSLNPQPQTAAKPTPIAPVSRPEVKVVEPVKLKTAQVVLTSLPNVINGIVSDAQGNYLEAAVVVIHNHEGLPVRASKTNKLGQFTGATPLQDGEYTVTIEKDNLNFDTLQVTLKGELISPLLISAKPI